MPRRRYTAEWSIGTLREAEVLIAQGRSAAEATWQIGVSEQACATSCWTAKSSTASRRSA